jgi:hypothetical protein
VVAGASGFTWLRIGSSAAEREDISQNDVGAGREASILESLSKRKKSTGDRSKVK